jgi:hypothetical protein
VVSACFLCLTQHNLFYPLSTAARYAKFGDMTIFIVGVVWVSGIRACPPGRDNAKRYDNSSS